MDTTETYIKMRLAAMPDLGAGIPIPKDYTLIHSHGHDGETYSAVCDGVGNWFAIHCSFNGDTSVIGIDKKNIVRSSQLERQDQLQEMVGYDNLLDACKEIPYPVIFEQLAIFLEETFEKSLDRKGTISWEQLWLAFAMKQQYNKTWDGNKWIKEVR